ncbi:AbiV family abortive infection protein [Dongia mobilis]|uniref:AbiV family abortive infection protein n=1 Tax=Dongia mobilis TaxID=578943 RepID=A0A4R6WMT7_9PROT|nr:AbiV family abortive infection protein [Dongia mobilis]TDQ80459.1 AbiV family abortive infection protein [Dongia mobilis]
MVNITVHSIAAKECVDNALRLMNDAHFLCCNNRFASAYFLACIAAEELGKFLILAWQEYEANGRLEETLRSHNAKQEAFACLIFAELLFRSGLRAAQVSEAVTGDRFTEVLTDVNARLQTDPQIIEKWPTMLTDLLGSDPHASIIAMSFFGEWQHVKHGALYSDRDPIYDRLPSSAEQKDVMQMIEVIDRALRIVSTTPALAIGALAAKKIVNGPQMKPVIDVMRQIIKDQRNAKRQR